MVGLFGAFGAGKNGLSELPSVQNGPGERIDSFADDHVRVTTAVHPPLAEKQPVRTTRDTLVWIQGDVYGFERNGSYRSRQANLDAPTFCANLYESYGIDFVEGVNGQFAGIIYDQDEQTVFLITDRLGSVPLFHTTSSETVLCSTDIQAVPEYPGVEGEFDDEYLAEYLAFKRSFGVTTPLDGIEKLRPATVMTIDLDTMTSQSRSYWQPTYTPIDKPFGYFVDRFVDLFQCVIDEWTHEDLEYGLLLSGGSDSRLIMAAMDQSLVGFHMNDWSNREASVARRVATAAGNEFVSLRRDDAYRRRTLDRNPSLSNFDGWYTQGYPTGFADKITSSVDVLLSGLYSDTLFKGNTLPSPTVSLGPLGKVTLPLESSIETVDDYIDKLAVETPAYLNADVDLEAVLRENITVGDETINHHGVEYPSLRELVLCGDYYPLSNDTELIYTNSLRQLCPYRTPFLDNRLIDLHLTMPVKYQLRRNIIHRAIERLDLGLASIPHSESGVPIKYSFPLEYVGKHLNALRRKFFDQNQPPKPWFTHGPWSNEEAFIRENEFVRDTLVRNRDLVEALPSLDWDGVRRCYRDHLDGADNTVELYTLLTLLEMPVTEQFRETELADSSKPGANKFDLTAFSGDHDAITTEYPVQLASIFNEGDA
ncbi:asparagine synthase-related protein [Halomicrococcus sp. NG-SE-24]|uniref:asparagine synthase-related protein n=1 Tax=Halomicrococcus sp. NG-SE-24 TaxID=3436928 RepID=UPI003D98D9F8